MYKTAKIGYVPVLLVHGKVVVEFGRKVFLVDCLLWKAPIKYGERKHNRTRSSLFIHTKTRSVTIQGNITAMRYRNDVIRSVLLLHIRVNLGMMLAWDYASCHVARSTLVMYVANNVQKNQMACKRSGFKSNRPLNGPIETQGSWITAATKSQGAYSCYLSDVCGHSTTVYS